MLKFPLLLSLLPTCFTWEIFSSARCKSCKKQLNYHFKAVLFEMQVRLFQAHLETLIEFIDNFGQFRLKNLVLDF